MRHFVFISQCSVGSMQLLVEAVPVKVQEDSKEEALARREEALVRRELAVAQREAAVARREAAVAALVFSEASPQLQEPSLMVTATSQTALRPGSSPPLPPRALEAKSVCSASSAHTPPVPPTQPREKAARPFPRPRHAERAVVQNASRPSIPRDGVAEELCISGHAIGLSAASALNQAAGQVLCRGKENALGLDNEESSKQLVLPPEKRLRCQ